MSRSGIKLSSLLLNSVVLVIMTIMTIEIEEKSESKSIIADLKPNLASLCPTPDPGIFTEKQNYGDDSSSEEPHPMIVPRISVDKEEPGSNPESEPGSDLFINNGCYQIANYPLLRKGSKPSQILSTPKPKYKQFKITYENSL